jgi:CDP-diacylglycerol--glycerol-3-phosphate 3-phosphatidyltransferase
LDRTAEKKTMSFTDFLRVRFKGLLDPIGAFLNRLGLKPNMVTVFGLIGTIVAAFLLARGQITWGGLLLVIMAPIDALDGTMARLRNEPTRFGGFVDSVTDRYAELVVFGGLLIHYVQLDAPVLSVLAYLAAAGSILVSYTRARAESLQYEAKIGLMTRVERYLILIPCLIFNRADIALWILAIATNFTALQRIWSVRRQAYAARDVVGLKDKEE